MDRFPQELAAALVGVFPRGNPSTDSWQQERGRSLEIGTIEGQNSDNPAMSAMFAVMRVLDGVEGSLRHVSGALGHAREDRRQLQREHDAEIERLTEEMTRLTHQRNAAWSREDVLRARQFELGQQLANAEEYNDNLHEEVHLLNNQLHPYVPPGATEMDLEGYEEGEEEVEPEEEVDPEEGDDSASNLDSDHDED